MAGERVLKAVLVGDAASLMKALAAADAGLKKTGDTTTQASVKVESFGKSFVKMGAGIGLGVAAVGAVVGVMHEAIGAVGDYNTAIDTATKTLLGQTKSQTETTAALAVARAEADKGRGTYQELAGAMAGLSTVAKTAGLSLAQVTETAEILAAINPEEGIKGATFALREAASGDMTSVIERFNLSRTTINKLRAEGVPAIEAVRQAMAELGYDTKFLDIANQSSAKTTEIAKGKFTELAAIVGKPFFDTFIQGVTAATKAVDGPGGVSFAQRLATELDLILHFFDGRVFEQLGVDVGKTLFLVSDAFNNLLKSLSGGKLNIDGPLKDLYNSITSAQAEVVAASKKGVTQPIADQLSGKGSGSPLASDKVQGYGAAVLDSFLQGLNSGQIGDFKQFTAQFQDLFKGADGKADTEAFAQAQSLLAQALKEVAQDGQISETTLFRLTTTFGKSAEEVTRLTLEYGRMGVAQDKATASAEGLKAAQQNLTNVQNQATNDLRGYTEAIDNATKTAADHAQAAADAIGQEQDALSALGKEAADVARADQAAINALQATAAANAEANQQIIAEAQAALSAATEQRKRDADIAQAAINGTTEAYERQTEGLTEQDRALAAHYETIIGGERRAKDAADERLNGLNKAANKEDLDFLTRIDEARKSGHAKEANALQRQFDARKKQRGSEIEIARAQAAVAGDEYDTKVDAINKEEKKKDEADAKAETAAGKRVAEVQAQADAQAKADAAAIKGAQDAAAADAERYRKQQEGIQAEIDKIQDAQKAQGIKDKQAITDAQTLKTERENVWKVEEAGATVALGFAGRIATENGKTATAAKDAYDKAVLLAPVMKQIADDAERAAAAWKSIPAYMTGTSGGTQGDDNGQNNGAPLPYAPPKPDTGPGTSTAAWLADNASRGWGPAIPGGTPPSGYHTETRPTGVWWVRDGWTLNAEGTGFAQAAPGPAPTPPGGNDAGSLGRAGGGALLREAGSPTSASAGGHVFNLHINAPGLTDIGNPAQQRALAAQVGDAALRAWTDVQRGGPPQGVV